MTLESNKELVRRLTAAWNEHDPEAFTEIYGDEVVVHGDDAEVRTRPEMIDVEMGFFDAFPDIDASIDHLVAEDDLVVVWWTVTGTHEGEFNSIEATGETVEYDAVAMYRVENDRIVEQWAQLDTLSLFDQLGAVEPP